MRYLKKILALLPLLAILFLLLPAQNAGAYVGEIWSTASVYYSPPGRGGEAEYVIYPARSGHIRFWYRNIYNSGDWVGRDMPILTCLGSVPCWGNVWSSAVGPNYKPDHADLISNDYYSGQGGYINDAGYFRAPGHTVTAFGKQWCDTCVD